MKRILALAVVLAFGAGTSQAKAAYCQDPTTPTPASTPLYTSDVREPSTQRTGPLGKPPGSYPSVGGSGMRGGDNVRLATADDQAEAAARVLILSGIPDLMNAGNMQLAAIQERVLNRQRIHQGEIEGQRIGALYRRSKIMTVQQAQDWYDTELPDDMHSRVTEKSDGSILALFIDNVTGQARGHEDFKSLDDMRQDAGSLLAHPAGC